MFFKLYSAISVFALTSLGHMAMDSPCPRYSGTGVNCPALPAGGAIDTEIKSPIGTSDGATQPLCKHTTPFPTPSAVWTAGQSATVSFQPGGAAHGGGHCQFSLSYDGGKTFVVIHDELRYCFNSGPTSSNSGSVLSYQISLPAELPSGNAVFAWSWVNAIGNREYYMNCADVEIKGGSGSYTGPQMLVANYGPDTPSIPEFNGNYDTGLDLFYGRPNITVTGSGSASPRAYSKGVDSSSSPQHSEDTQSAASPAAYIDTAAPPAYDSGVVLPSGQEAYTDGSPGPNSGDYTASSQEVYTDSAPPTAVGSGDSGSPDPCKPGATRCCSSGNGFEVCVNGKWNKFECAQGTKCQFDGGHPQCKLAAQ